MTTLQKLADGAERTKAGFVIVTDDAKIIAALDELGITKHLVPTPPANRVCAVVDDDRWTWMIVNHTTPGDGGYVAIGVDTTDFPGGKQGAVDFFAHAMMSTGTPVGGPKLVSVVVKPGAETASMSKEGAR